MCVCVCCSLLVNCSDPTPPVNGSIFNITGTTLYETAMYTCDSGFRPAAIQNSSCLMNATWTPDPGLHTCTEIVGNGEEHLYDTVLLAM